MIHVNHTKPWINEEWTCTFTKAEPPFSDFSFCIKGSVTGPDGEGNAGKNFISQSGRVIINGGDAEQGGDWHLKRSYTVLKTIVNSGDSVKWKTYSISTNTIVPVVKTDSTIENNITLFQGVSNTSHILKIIKTGESFPPISKIKVYKPFWHHESKRIKG